MEHSSNIAPPQIGRRPEKSKPPWLKVRLPSHSNYFEVAEKLRGQRLHTICQSARCPNIGECWSEKTATFLILGDVCTRSCAFCAVTKGVPGPPDADEPRRVAETAAAFGLSHVVLTSVTRDDLSDGGASAFARTAAAVKARNPEATVEVLIPDFQGQEEALEAVIAVRPDVVNHNLEVPERLYPRIGRAQAFYRRSLGVLSLAKAKGAVTKSGLMLGLGESEAELLQALSDLRRVSCDLLTLGQYLQPRRDLASVNRYYSPEEFEHWKRIALGFGFRAVEAGPLVRSSYHARRMVEGLSRGFQT
jgi:lipoic acid synthetase